MTLSRLRGGRLRLRRSTHPVFGPGLAEPQICRPNPLDVRQTSRLLENGRRPSTALKAGRAQRGGHFAYVLLTFLALFLTCALILGLAVGSGKVDLPWYAGGLSMLALPIVLVGCLAFLVSCYLALAPFRPVPPPPGSDRSRRVASPVDGPLTA